MVNTEKRFKSTFNGLLIRRISIELEGCLIFCNKFYNKNRK